MTEHPTRRAVLASALAAFAAFPALAAGPRGAPIRRVSILGDSIAAGFGLPAGQALPAKLQAELSRLGVSARVTAQARVGDTTAGGLGRVHRATPPGTEAASWPWAATTSCWALTRPSSARTSTGSSGG